MNSGINPKASMTEDGRYKELVTSQAIHIMFGNLPGIAISVSLMTVVMVWVMWASSSHVVLLAWAAIIMMITLVEIAMGRTFLQQPRSHAEARKWGRSYTYISVINGLSWGSACVLFFVSGSAALQVFLFTCMVGMATASIIQHSYWLESYYAFTLPLLILSGMRLYWEGGIAYQGLALLTLVLLAIVIQMAHESKNSVLAAITLRFENLDLIERLREEKEKAEIASHDKTRFLASASHDLRQPVHALTLFADAMQPELVSQKSKILLGNMGRSIEAINQLLGSLLDISKLDAKIVQATPRHLALRPLLMQLNAEYSPQARAKGLSWQVDDAEWYVYSDPVLLDVMLRNLISNAIRYTRSGEISVTCSLLQQALCITVTDTGIGIPAHQMKDIFREFYQVENTERDRSKGLGLGLAIVERVANLLQHRISVESEPGFGSRFSITLPIGDPAAISATLLDTIVPQRDVSGMRVLVIEDEADVRAGMQAVLEGWECTVILAGSEAEAVEKLQAMDAPHVIFADYRLRENKTGVQAITRIRQLFGSDIPSLIITGDTDPECLREAQDSGHVLMHKPLQPGRLRAYLRAIQRRKA